MRWTEVDRDWLRAELESRQESANYWRHVARELAGQDPVKLRAAEDRVCDKFIAAGAKRIGPTLPRYPGPVYPD